MTVSVSPGGVGWNCRHRTCVYTKGSRIRPPYRCVHMSQVKTAAAAAPMHLKAAASGNRIGEPEGVGWNRRDSRTHAFEGSHIRWPYRWVQKVKAETTTATCLKAATFDDLYR